MKHKVSININTDRLNTFECSCGIKRYFSEGMDAKHVGGKHANNHGAEETHFIDGVEISRNRRKAVAGRPNGMPSYAIGGYRGRYV